MLIGLNNKCYVRMRASLNESCIVLDMSNVESVVGGLVGFVRKDRLRGINLVDDEAQIIFVRWSLTY